MDLGGILCYGCESNPPIWVVDVGGDPPHGTNLGGDPPPYGPSLHGEGPTDIHGQGLVYPPTGRCSEVFRAGSYNGVHFMET